MKMIYKMNELKIQAWIVRYMSDPFSFDEMNEIINDFNYELTHLEQRRAIGLLRREYDALGFD